MPSLTFGGPRPFDPADHRPHANVCLTGPSGRRLGSSWSCLIDTGADYIVLPEDAAILAGITLSRTPKTLRGLVGGASAYIESGVNIAIETHVITIDVLFIPTAMAAASTFIPVVGRATLLSIHQLGFQGTDWYWT